jgi:serine/threonine protein kinase
MTTPAHGDTNDQGIAGPGGVFLDQYVLLELLNDSRRGAIYKAKHRLMGRTVAIKFLSDQAAASRQFTERFHRATKILALLEHPNLVRAHEAAQQGTTNYLVMEYIDGDNLQYLTKADGPLPVAKAIDYALQAASGLAYAHDQGVIHRNVKPSKLVLDKQGAVKIVGFGLAQIEKDGALGDEAESLTVQGQVLGSYEYMAPEQAANAKNADQRSDIYGLGCTLHSLLTGRPPYEGKGPTMQIVAHTSKPVPSLCAARPEVPEALDRIFAKMLAKKPDDRFGSMAEVVRELKACLPAKATGKTDATPPAEKPRPALATPAPEADSASPGSNKLIYGIAGATLVGMAVIWVAAFGIPGSGSGTREKPAGGKPTDVAKSGTTNKKPETRPSPDQLATSTRPQPVPKLPSLPPAKEPAAPRAKDKPKPPQTLAGLLDKLPPDEPKAPPAEPPPVPKPSPELDPKPTPTPKPQPSPTPREPEAPVSTANTLPPVPSEQARTQASELMRDTFEADLAQANTPDKKGELAKRLLSVARDISDDPAGRYVILEEATRLAADSGEFATGLAAIDSMAHSFQIDAWSKKVDWLAACAEAAKSAEQRRAAATEAFELAKTADDAAQFAIADRLCTLAETEGKKAAPFPLIKQIRIFAADVTKRLEAHTVYEAAKQKLAADGSDRQANLTVGRYECFVIGNWSDGLAKLAICSDTKLQALAAKELAAPTSPDQLVEVADGWHDLAEIESEQSAGRIHLHAAEWYEKAARDATGLLKTKAERRLDESRAAAVASESKSDDR